MTTATDAVQADRALKAKHRAMWALGDYPAVARDIVGDLGPVLVRASGVGPGERVLDVAAGSGNAAIPAARAGASVVASDLTPELFEAGRAEAARRGAQLEWRQADAENLPFADATFDVVLSTFGVMFTPNQDRAAAELMRVCKPKGKIGLANWTPEGFIGQVFKTLGKHLPPAAGARSPAVWGTSARLTEMFDADARSIRTESRLFKFRYRSPSHFLDVFKTYYGPVLKAFAALEPAKQEELHNDLHALIVRMNRSGDGTMVVPSEYLEVVITKR